MSDTLASPPPVTPGLSQIERVIDTFVAPSKTFEDIRRNTSWWLPFVLMLLGSLATAYAIQTQVGFLRATETQIHASSSAEEQMNQLPPDQRAERMALSAKITGYITWAVPIILPLGFALYALILWACFNFILGAQTTFWQVFATCFYASLPYLLLNVLVLITLYFGGSPENYNFQYPAGTSPAYYMPDLTPWLRALLARFDVIQLWTLALTTYGMSIISKKTMSQSVLVVGGFWFIVTILAVGRAALTS